MSGHLVSPTFQRRRAPQQRMDRLFGHVDLSDLRVLNSYRRGDMARRAAKRREVNTDFRGPIEGGWLWSQRVAVVRGVHVALAETSALGFVERDRIAMAVARQMPCAPKAIYWDNRFPMTPPG